MKFTHLGNPKYGIRIYRSGLNANMSLMLDNSLTHEDSCNVWTRALVAYGIVPDDKYRNCYDFKLSEDQLENVQETIGDIYQETVGEVVKCVNHYSSDYGIQMTYMEAVNFVKYGIDEHFSYHSDHAYHYVCTVSTVGYFNDDYDGGELRFDKLDLSFKPKEGDIVVFPSTFIYSHASLPVTKGVKYAAVTMFDYNNEYSAFRRNMLSGRV